MKLKKEEGISQVGVLRFADWVYLAPLTNLWRQRKCSRRVRVQQLRICVVGTACGQHAVEFFLSSRRSWSSVTSVKEVLFASL